MAGQCTAQDRPAASNPVRGEPEIRDAGPFRSRELKVPILEQLDLKLPVLVAQKEELLQQLQKLEIEQSEMIETLHALRPELEQLTEMAKARLVALYKFQQMGYAISLLSTHDPQEAPWMERITKRLLEEDHRILRRLEDRQTTLQNLEKILSQISDRTNAIKLQKEAREQEILSVQRKKAELLDQVRQDESLYAQYHAAFMENQLKPGDRARYRRPIFDFRSGTFSELRGALPLPTAGKVVNTYASEGGAGSPSLYQNGILIQASLGQPVQAVYGGLVVYADWFKEYGKVMIIDHGEHYYSLIAHADELLRSVGDSVESGEQIATVGNSGSSGEVGLYFELRHYGKAVDPMEWLAVHTILTE
jgi:septal ring factor EnvC (AmiA/AmiB activator)